ncbi:DUF4388 domain-containing protein [Anaeromyxobacter sp. Fw109-5]|uniref:DUF4388 domain-containing protein n=1 Tax=Anaeromyxobacter sp. (strain Fw109-5) TaxID=404589 RepID=UPI000158A461|nr:DUF4388 domain-containing protein [Anaeromyxobacter sp. Fw109-5]ABS24694.1 conserved hypothetical protein [Anaeromyxobacter sp. Fw109-5]
MRARLSVGRDGEVLVPPREAEALGLGGGGEVDLVSARGAFALLVPARGDEAPRAWFAGSLAALTVPEVIQFVFTSLKTGVLLLAFGEDAARAAPDTPDRLRRKSIYFRDGQVVFASSSDPSDRLGPVLLREGLVGEEELARCARLARAGRPLGQVLVDEGVLGPGQLYEGVTRQVREIVLGAFAELTGEFAFLEGPVDDATAVKLPERTRELLLAGMKRLEEAEAARAAATTPGPGEPEVTIEIAPPEPAAPARASGPFETYRRIFRRVHAALAAVTPDAADRLNGYLAQLPDKRRAPFAGVHVQHDGDLDVAQVLGNVSAAGAHRGAAARARALEALDELLAFALFEAKNRLPREEAERLLREVGRMQVGKG